MQTTDRKYGVGASLLRREDDRHLRGRGEFVSDIRLPGTMEVAFLRSPHAHARIKRVAVPPEYRGCVFTAADLPRLQPIRIVTSAPGAKSPRAHSCGQRSSRMRLGGGEDHDLARGRLAAAVRVRAPRARSPRSCRAARDQ